MRVRQKPIEGTAYQFTVENIDALKQLLLPTGPVTVQAPDEINRVPARCYVPTVWGAAVLDLGDWFMLLDNGIVVAIPAEQVDLLIESAVELELELEPEPEPVEPDIELWSEGFENVEEPVMEPMMMRMAPASRSVNVSRETLGTQPVMRAVATQGQFEAQFEQYCETYRMDYSSFTDGEMYLVTLNATGREVLRCNHGDVVLAYADGRMEVLDGVSN